MTGRSERWRHWLCVVALSAALAGCETTPPPPLMSPLQVAKFYGYADAAVGDNRYQVTYVGPNRRSLRSLEIRQAVDAAERTQAFDFALWRAAQIATAQGFAGFSVANVRSNVNTVADFYDDPFYGPYGGGFYPYRRPFGPFWGAPWGPSPYAYQQAEVTIDARLTPSPGSGEYVARDVIDQLRRTYPGAEGPSAGTIAPS